MYIKRVVYDDEENTPKFRLFSLCDVLSIAHFYDFYNVLAKNIYLDGYTYELCCWSQITNFSRIVVIMSVIANQ